MPRKQIVVSPELGEGWVVKTSVSKEVYPIDLDDLSREEHEDDEAQPEEENPFD
jgi:hypothetical protein